MTAEITTVIGQLNIKEGTWHSEAFNQVAVREPKSRDNPGTGKGDLFVLTEILGSADNLHHLEQTLAGIVRDAYYLARGSITASLRRAMQAAADYLYQYNAEIPVDDRVVGGVVALVVQGEDTFMAQVGPAACFTVRSHHVRRYPEQSIWLDDITNSADNDELALGISTFIEPNLYHLYLTPEDVVVLADSNLVSHLTPADLIAAVNSPHIATVTKNIGQVIKNEDCSALTLSIIEKSESKLGPLNMPVSTHLHKLLPTNGQTTTEKEATPFPVSASATSPSPLDRLTPVTSWLTKPFQKEEPSADDRPVTDEEADWDNQPTPPKATPSPVASAAPAGHSSAKVMASATPEPAFEPQLQDNQSPLGSFGGVIRGIGAALLMLVAALASGLKNILGLFVGDQAEAHPRQAGRQATATTTGPTFNPWKTLLGLAIAIPLIVGAIVAISYLRNQRLQETNYTNLITTARDKIAHVQEVDSGSALGLMAEAENLLIQAEKIKTGQPEIAEMRAQIAAQTDDISRVERFFYLPQLRRYTDSGSNLKQILVQGVELYVLDNGLNRVYHHRLDNLGEGLLPDDETVLLVQQGQVVDDITVADLIDMVWMPSGGNRQTSDLLILNSTGLLEFNPNWGITTASLRAKEQLVNPVAAESFFGNFYVLDPQSNRILRYFPTADGYGAVPENYFPPDQLIDLDQAVDFAIDGSVYVLFQDGRVSKFTSGRPVEFQMTGLDKPLKLPSSIFTAPDEEVQHVYIADAGNQRIVQLDKNGSFIRQFKPGVDQTVTFTNLQDIYVDEIGSRVYILDSNNLYLGNLPSE